jgi:uncharacterized cupin superfamily protein
MKKIRRILGKEQALEVTHKRILPQEVILAGAPHGGYTVFFQGREPAMAVGVYESSGPGAVHLRDYPHDEFCLLVKGDLVIRDMSGEEHRFRAGDTFVIPRGFEGEWIMETVIRKQFVVAADVEAE